MVFGDVVESKGIYLIHAAKNAKFYFDFPQLLLHLFIQSQNWKFILFIHQKIADSDIFLPFLLWLALTPPNQLNVKGAYLHTVFDTTIGEIDLQIITFGSIGL